MWKKLIAPFLIVFVGAPLMFFWNPLNIRWQTQQQVNTSDAKATKGIIKIGTDNFIGYYPLFSPYMLSLMRTEGFSIVADDDKADYEKRFEKLSRGEIQFAVATVDAYQLNGLKTAFPGTIVAVLDVSQGADAIVSCKKEIQNIDDLKKGGLKIAFTPGSPSEHLIKANAIHFDIPQLRGNDKSWRVETNGSAEAAQKCAAGVVDIAALWEPDVTRLLRSNPQTKKLIGTENTSRLIVDVLIVRREFARDNPEVVKTFLSKYFQTLYYYRQNPETAAIHAANYVNVSATAGTQIKPEEVANALKGVAWVSLGENALLWFGVDAEAGQQPQFGLLETIDSTLRLLIENGDLKKSPFIREDPGTIVQSSFIKELYQGGLVKENVDLKGSDPLTREFSELSEPGWALLREIGTLRVRPVIFQSGADTLSVDAKENVDEIVKTLKSYPNFRILIEGHTGTRGDMLENKELSQERAEAVARYLMVTYGVKENRIRAIGYGGTKPLRKTLEESERSYQTRLSRVVVKLVTEAY